MIDFDKIPSPCFVLEEGLLRRNLEILDSVQKETGAQILCALKGFAMYSTFPMVKEYLPTCTASSLNEARLCFEEFGEKAHLCAPVYLEHEFDELTKYTSHITFNSLGQWDRFKQSARNAGLSCALRINPEYSEVETDLYNPCMPGSRLGITANKLDNQLPEGIEGLHFHALCEDSAETLQNTLKAVEEKFGKYLHQAKWLNMGGGHHITRKDYNIELLIELIKNISDKYDLNVILEPGEAVGWQTGYLVSSVQDIFENDGVQIAMLDVSVAAHMPDCLEMPYKPKVLCASDPVKGKPTYRFGGMTCLSGDFIGDYSFDQPLSIGDKIIFDDMIHYTMVKTTTFNGVGLPAIGIWTEDNMFKLIRKFGFDSYKDRLS